MTETQLQLKITHPDGTRMRVAEKLLAVIGAQDFVLGRWLDTLDDLELRSLGRLMYSELDEASGRTFVERLSLVMGLLSRERQFEPVEVAAEVLSESCALFSVFAGMTLCRRQGLIDFESLPRIPVADQPLRYEATSKGMAVAGDLNGLLRAVLIPN